MNGKYFVLSAAAAMIALTGLAADSNYDFEKSVNGALPKGYTRIKDKWCGGTFEIIDDECGSFKKALKVVTTENKKALRILMDRPPRIQVKPGDQLVYEFSAKGKGYAVIGYYGFTAGKKFCEFVSASANVNSDKWQKITLRVTCKKPETAEISPFFQTNSVGMIFSGLKISIVPKNK